MSLICVGSLVIYQVVSQTKCLPTNVAGMDLLIPVYGEMGLKITSCVEPFTADVTHVRFLPCVDAAMLVKCREMTKFLATHITKITVLTRSTVFRIVCFSKRRNIDGFHLVDLVVDLVIGVGVVVVSHFSL